MAEFKVPTIFSAVDKFSSVVRSMSATSSAALDRMDRKMKRIGDSAFAVSRKAALVGAAIIAPLVVAGNEAVAFEKSMSNVSTLIDTSVEDMDRMGQEVLDLATKLPVPIEEMTSALFDIRSAGIDASQAMDTLETASKLSVAGLGSVQEATDVLTSSMNAFSAEGLTANQIADILFKTTKFGKTTIAEVAQQFGASAPIIQSAGVSLAEFSAATSALTTVGLPAAQAQNQLKAAISNLNKPTKEMQVLFDALNVTTGSELIESSGGLVNAFGALQDKAAELDVNMSKAFGSVEAMNAVTSLTGQTSEAFVTALDDMTKGANALDTAFGKQQQTASAQMQVAKNNIKAATIAIGNELLPIISDLLQSLTPMVKSFTAWVRANRPLVASIIKLAIKGAALAFAVSGIAFAVGAFTKVARAGILVMRAYNFLVGVMGALTGVASISINQSRNAMLGYNIATKVAAATTKIFNTVMKASPFGLVLTGLLAIGGAVAAWSAATSGQTRAQKLANEVHERAVQNSVDQLAEVRQLFSALKKAAVGSTEFNNTLQQLEQLQPGIIDKYNLQAGALKNIEAAEKSLTQSILERAKAEARAQIITDKTKELVEAELSLQNDANLNAFERVKLQGRISDLQGDIDILGDQTVRSEQAEQVRTNIETGRMSAAEIEALRTELTINFENVPDFLQGLQVQGKGKNINTAGVPKPKLGTTN